MTTTALIVDVDRLTGDLISGWPRCRQSIVTIATTRLETRLMRLWFGCNFIDVMDKPMVQQSFTDSIGELAEAINTYEPEFTVTQVSITPSSDGSCTCTIDGTYLPDSTVKRVTATTGSSSSS